MLVSAIVAWTNSVFNSQQVGRLVQELRAIGQRESLDDRTQAELEGAAAFIARETTSRTECFVVFIGN